MSPMQNCLLFPMVGLKSEIFAFIAENFTVEVLLQNLWTTLYNYSYTYLYRTGPFQADRNLNHSQTVLRHLLSWCTCTCRALDTPQRSRSGPVYPLPTSAAVGPCRRSPEDASQRPRPAAAQ